MRGSSAPSKVVSTAARSPNDAPARTRVAGFRPHLGLLAALACATTLAAACGSEDGNGDLGRTDPGVDGGGGGDGSNVPGTDGAAPDDAEEPIVVREFPTKTPSIGGYTFDAAYTEAPVAIPSAMVWPKVAGALPIVLERMGTVVELTKTGRRPVLDFSASVALRGEGGALGMALHPQFGDGTGPQPYAYFWYNALGSPKNRQRLSRFRWDAASRTFDRASETMLLDQEEEAPVHNAARVLFGPDGFLYFANGDDTNTANHQTITRALFAGLFRIDVDMKGGAVSHPPPRTPDGATIRDYYIPNDNPFVGQPGVLEEYWALGLRNPFSFSFDRATGDIWSGDVGESWREEVNKIVKGGNYGWPWREGELRLVESPITIGTEQAPVLSYTHHEMADLTAIFGGFVYRGAELPELTGKFIFADWPSGRLWALDPATRTRVTLSDNPRSIEPMSLVEDNAGEIYLLHTKGIAKLARDPNKDTLPTRLRATTLFSDVPSLTPAAGLVPYEINATLWSDGASKKRWIRLPAGQHATLGDDGKLSYPVGTAFIKQFDLPETVNPVGRSRRLETRVLVVGEDKTYGVTYRWNPEGTDAFLVTEPTDEVFQDDAAKQSRTWHFPSFSECWSCHREANRVIGFTARQVQFIRADGSKQIDALVQAGVFTQETIAKLPAPLARPSDTTASLEERAMAYLSANCSSCHHEGASYLGGEQTWIATPGVALASRGLVGAPHHNWPMARAFNLSGAPLVDPGKPENSILLARIKSTNLDLQMPPLARSVVDPDGAALIEQWIRSMQ